MRNYVQNIYSTSFTANQRYINGKGDIIVHIYTSSLGNTLISLPREEEQVETAQKINEIINRTNSIIDTLYEEISTLREYKNRLISDVVTGQIDVRSIEVPEYEFVDEDNDFEADDDEELEEVEEQEG